jgi:hypothetical protein
MDINFHAHQSNALTPRDPSIEAALKFRAHICNFIVISEIATRQFSVFEPSPQFCQRLDLSRTPLVTSVPRHPAHAVSET